MDTIAIEKKIDVLTGRAPITFAHQRGEGIPNTHQPHMNDHLEIYVFVSGDVDYVIEENYFALRSHDVLIIPPHSTHVPVIRSGCVYERFYLLFPTDTMSAYSSDPLAALIEQSRGGLCVPLTGTQRERMITLLLRMSTTCREASADDLALHALALELICLLRDAVTLADGSDVGARQVPGAVRDALAYIAADAPRITGVGEIAQRLYLSVPYLCSVFKQHVGVTVSAYLRAKKISAAKELLHKGHSVTYTCYECGFNDTSYFIKVFRSCVGMTPREYAVCMTGSASAADGEKRKEIAEERKTLS